MILAFALKRVTRLQTAALTSVVLILLMSGAVFAYASRTTGGLGLNAPGLLDEGDHPTTCSTTSSSSSSSTASSTSTSSSTSHSETTSHTESAHQTKTCESQSEQESKSSTSASGTHTEEENAGAQVELEYRVVPVSSGSAGKGEANIHANGLVLQVHVEIEQAAPSATYDIFLIATLVASTTSTTFTTTTSTTTASTGVSTCPTEGKIGGLVTNHEGNGDAEDLQATLAAGTYRIGLLLCKGTTPSLITDPATRTAQLSPSGHTESKSESESETRTAHVTSASKGDEDAIKGAEDKKTIPAVVVVGKSGVAASVIDPSFSVSTGKLENGGVSVTISATNVTGARVLLVNLTDTQSYNLQSGTIVVTLDGVRVQEASSVLQVLNAQPTDPARFIIIQTSSGLQLLISIPHFSVHAITILPVIFSAVTNLLMVDAPLLALSVLAISSVFAIAYARRPRFFRFFQ